MNHTIMLVLLTIMCFLCLIRYRNTCVNKEDIKEVETVRKNITGLQRLIVMVTYELKARNLLILNKE